MTTSNNELIIRTATPADAALAAPLVLSSAPDVYAYLFTRLGKQAEEFVRHCLTLDKGLFGCQAHTVVELDGQVVGVASFYSKAEYFRWAKQTSPIVAAYYRWRVPFMLLRLNASQRWMVPPVENELYLANFGVATGLRGQGIGGQMLQYGLALAQQRELAIYSLDVSVANPNAERLYQRFGMHSISEASFPGARGRVSDSRRMQMSV